MLLLVLAALCCTGTRSLANELQLYASLLDGYENYERPVRNSSSPLCVAMGIVFQQIIQVDEKNQIVEANVWLKLSWSDYKLKWDPEKYGGIRRLRFKKSRLWTPDILLYNSAHREFDSAYATNLVAHYNGLVKWKLPGIFKLSCIVNMAWFPFDEQRCFMKFGSWTYDGSKINLTEAEDSFDVSSYLDNGEWILADKSVDRTIKYYNCCPEPYYDLKFKFTLRRRTTAYAFSLIVPCTLITMLTLVGFVLPPEAGEKVSYQVSLMLSVCIFQNYVSEMSPPTSEALPFLGAFFALCMITVSISVVWTVIALNLYQRDEHTHQMSKTMRKVMLHWLPWILLMHRPESITVEPQKKKKERQFNKMQKRWEWSRISRGLSLHSNNASLMMLEQLCYHTIVLNETFEDEDAEKQAETEWKYAASVIDRLCLFVLTTFFLSIAVALFSFAPEVA